MKVALLPPAQLELDEAFAWYESQVVGLGYGFLDECNRAVRLAVSFPELYQQVSPGVRRCLLNRFPYGLLWPDLWPERRHDRHRCSCASQAAAELLAGAHAVEMIMALNRHSHHLANIQNTTLISQQHG